MHTDGTTIFEFNEYHFMVRNLQASGTMQEDLLYYSPYPLIRDGVRKMVNVLVSDFRHLFATDVSSAGHEPGEHGRGAEMANLIERLEYFTIQGDVLTVVSGEGKFVKEPIKSPLLLSLISHIKRLLVPVDSAVEHSDMGEAYAGGDSMPGVLDTSQFICRRCGVCCHRFAVVVKPGEWGPIAALLHITVDALRARCLEMEPFSWSEHNALIRRIPSPGKKAARNDLQCVFLKEEAEKIHCCSIYDARPSACRRYVPGTSLCLSSR